MPKRLVKSEPETEEVGVNSKPLIAIDMLEMVEVPAEFFSTTVNEGILAVSLLVIGPEEPDAPASTAEMEPLYVVLFPLESELQ